MSSSFLPTLCFTTLLILISRGNANSLIYLDIAHDQIAMSSEIQESTISPGLQETAAENEDDPGAKRYAINCFPDFTSKNYDTDKAAEECLKKGCTWYPRGTGKNWESYCFTPKDYGYVMEGLPQKTANGYIVMLKKYDNMTYFGNDSEKLVLTVEYQSDYRLRFTFTDMSPRWKVPIKIQPPKEPSKMPLYDLLFTNDPLFSMRITRKSSGVTIFDTSLGGLTFSDRFLQITTKLPSKNIYGFGEHKQRSFKHDFHASSVWPLYSQDYPNKNDTVTLDGVHPYYSVLENDGNAHSVMIVNSNAQEMELLPVPALIYRTIGGVLDFYVFMGPTPGETVQQFTEAVGRPFLPPYWALGLGLGTDKPSVDDMKDLLEIAQKNNIPYDVLYGYGRQEKDNGENSTDNYNTELMDLVNNLKGEEVDFMLTVDPSIFVIHDTNSQELSTGPSGRKCNEFGNKEARSEWQQGIEDYQMEIGFSGVYLDHNHAFVDDGKHKRNDRSHTPHGFRQLKDVTTGTKDFTEVLGLDCDIHKLYGWTQTQMTMDVLQKSQNRTLLLSKATFIGSGKWAGHIFEHNEGKWWSLQQAVIQLLQFNNFGIPLVGANIKSDEDTGNEIINDELYLRWIQLQAFHPLARLPAGGDLQSRGDDVIEGIQKVMKIRYNLLPHLYTLFYEANIKGNAVVRPLWHEFRKDSTTYDIDRQFMWGSGLLISPVLEAGAKSLEVYIPRDRWYDYYTGSELTERGRFLSLDAPVDKIPLLIRGHHIIPTQEPALNTKLSRNNNYTLIVALCAKGNGKGQLFLDDGQSIDSLGSGDYFLGKYSVTNKTLEGHVENNGYPEISSKYLAAIRLLGAADVHTIKFNGEKHEAWKAVPNSAEIYIRDLNIPINSNFTLSWTTGDISA